MKGLDPAIEHFRKAGVIAQIGDHEAGVPERTGGSAG
jgi:hypothetical protein